MALMSTMMDRTCTTINVPFVPHPRTERTCSEGPSPPAPTPPPLRRADSEHSTRLHPARDIWQSSSSVELRRRTDRNIHIPYGRILCSARPPGRLVHVTLISKSNKYSNHQPKTELLHIWHLGSFCRDVQSRLTRDIPSLQWSRTLKGRQDAGTLLYNTKSSDEADWVSEKTREQKKRKTRFTRPRSTVRSHTTYVDIAHSL
jgi:hypothetical protein